MADDFDVESFPDEFTIVRVGDEFTVEQWPDEFIILDNSDDWTIYTTVEAQYTLEFQSVGLNDAAIAVAARDAAVAAQVQADADVVLTHADVVLTHADAAQTAADRIQTGLDKAGTAADRVQTGLDSVATAADRVQTGLDRTQTGLDKTATAADRVQTGLDRAQTGADRVQTGLDRVATGNDVTTANALLAAFTGGTTGQILIKHSNANYDFSWTNPTGMLTAIYDPTNIAADVFARANHTGTQLAATISNFNAAADARIAAAVGVSVQGYSAILAGTTASYTVALDTKLGGIATGADVTVSALPVAIHGAVSKATPVGADELALSDSAAAFGLKKLTWTNLLEGVRAFLYGTNKAVPVDADIMTIGDSAAANAPKYSSFTQIKAFLKTYFDTLYGRLATVATWTAQQTFKQQAGVAGPISNYAGSSGSLQAQALSGVDPAVIEFHRPGVFAAMFGLDTDNTWKVGGWSMGAVAYRIFHQGYMGPGSGLNADLLDGFNADQTGAVSTVAVRDGAGDVVARLHRTEWTGGGWNGTYLIGMNANGGVGTDNYGRPASIASVMSSVFGAGFTSAQQTITAGGSLTIAHGLGVKPKVYLNFLQCVTAQANYAVGDEIFFTAANGSNGVVVVADATNLNVRFGSNASPTLTNDKNTGSAIQLTNANWRLVIRAWG